MRILDSHFHYYPRAFFELLCKRKGYPRAEADGKGGYNYWRKEGVRPLWLWPEWFDVDRQLEHMDSLGHEIDVFCSIGPFSVHFSDVPVEEGREHAMLWNEEMAKEQRNRPGRFWASCAVPMVDTEVAVDVLNHAIVDLGLRGVNIPGSVGSDPRIDADRLEPLYDRIEALDVAMFLHPTDAIFAEALEGYDGALFLSLGRVIEVSVAASRLIFSGMMERHPQMKVVMSHTGGALPYQSGRMDKNGKRAKLPHPPSDYIKRMYTDTVSPHMLGIKFAVDYYGVDHVLYGSDYPCWSPADAIRLFSEVGLSAQSQEKILNLNARHVLGLETPTTAAVKAKPALQAAAT